MPPLFQRVGAVVFSACLFSVVSHTSTAGQQPATPAPAAPDVTTLGPQVGETLPDFSLPDQQGRTRTLSSLMGPKGLVLVFNRSAEW